MIIDMDVKSYYPNVVIASEFYPEHLGKDFCVFYKQLYEMRKKYPKGSIENEMLKLALNGTYGDTNSKFSVFYDPLVTMRTTLNGQLFLCVLACFVILIIYLLDINKIKKNYDLFYFFKIWCVSRLLRF